MSKSKTNMSEQKIFDDIIDEYGTEGFLLKDDTSPFGIEIAGQSGSMCSAGSAGQCYSRSGVPIANPLLDENSSDEYESFEEDPTEPLFETEDSSSECSTAHDDESSEHDDQEPFFKEDKPLKEEARSEELHLPRISTKYVNVSRRECPLRRLIPTELRKFFGNSHYATSLCITLVCVILGFLIDPIYFLIGILPLIYMLLSVGESGLALKLGTLMILVSMNYGNSIIPFMAIALFVF